MLYIANRKRTHSFETRRALEAADGYLFLKMTREALGELDFISAEDQENPDVLLARIRVLLQQRRWREAEALSALGFARNPEEDEFTVQRAFALHQMDKADKAIEAILAAPEWLRRSGILHYNLACYEARLGDLVIARQCMDAAIGMNAEMKKKARIDPDLEALWN